MQPVTHTSCVSEALITAHGALPKTTAFSNGLAPEKPRPAIVMRCPPSREAVRSAGWKDVTAGTLRSLWRPPPSVALPLPPMVAAS